MGMRFTERKTSRSRFDPFLSIKFLIELIKKNFHAFLLRLKTDQEINSTRHREDDSNMF